MPDLDLSVMSGAAGPLQTWVLPALLGLGLASATGLRTFLPLLMLALAARFELFGVRLIDQMDWLVAWPAIAALAAAPVVETRSRPSTTRSISSATSAGRSRGPSRRAACSGTWIRRRRPSPD